MTTSPEALALIDFRRFDGDANQRAAFLRDLRDAARGPGFFYLTRSEDVV